MLRLQPIGLQRCGQLSKQIKEYCLEANSLSPKVPKEDIPKSQKKLSGAISSLEGKLKSKQEQIEGAEGN